MRYRSLAALFVALVIAVVAARALAPRPAPGAQGHRRASAVKVTILSTMLADDPGVGEWGFSALVEVDGRRLLFDTGAYSDTVLRNARELGVDLSDIEEVILSHNHNDHTGGLVALRTELTKKNPRALARAHVGRGIFAARTDGNPMIETRARYEALGGAFVEHTGPVELFDGVWLTGPVPRVYPEKNWSVKGKVETEAGLVEDNIPEDQSLVIDTDRGLVLVSGCGHAGIVNTIMQARRTVRDAPVHVAIGGFHLFPADDAKLAWTADRLRELQLEGLVGAHCTGIEATYALRSRLGLARRDCVVGAVGASFTLGAGIDPRRVAR